MSLAPIDVVIFVGYFVGIIALGVYASRRVGQTKRDYFLAGDKLPWWMVGGSIVAANISSHHFIGVIGTAYSRGFVAMCIEWGAIIIGFNALLWVFLPFYLRNGFTTMPEFLERRFGAGARLVYAVLILITYIFVEISAVLFLGAVALNSLFGIRLLVSIVALALLTGAYTILGGLRAVVYTEMVQLVVLIVGGLTLSFATLHHVGGWHALMATSSNWHLLLPATDEDFPWTMYLGGVVCVSVFYCAANQFIVQRTLAAKDEWHARMGVVFTDYLKFLMPLIIVVPGLLAPQIFPHLDKPDMAFPMLVKTLLPPGLVGLVMAGLIAAIMSHLSGAVNSCTTILTVDLYVPYINPRASEAQAVRFGKIMGAVTVVTGILWATVLLRHSDKPVFVYLLNAYGYVTPGIATMFLLGIFWRGTTHAGALVAGLLTIPLSLSVEAIAPHLPGVWPKYIGPFWNRTGIVFWTCMLVGVLVSVFGNRKKSRRGFPVLESDASSESGEARRLALQHSTQQQTREAQIDSLIWNKESLHLPEAIREKSRGLRSPALWWAIITAIVVFMYIKYR